MPERVVAPFPTRKVRVEMAKAWKEKAAVWASNAEPLVTLL
jgi:hypothetical protein